MSLFDFETFFFGTAMLTTPHLKNARAANRLRRKAGYLNNLAIACKR
ncbi:MAG: hypothetical protein RIB80_00745 [Rhodospirillales bacterium]